MSEKHARYSVISYKNSTPVIDPTVFIADGARIIGDVVIASKANIWYNVTIRGDVNYIRIGQRTNIQDNSVIHVAHQTFPTLIGDDVTVGHSAVIHACTVHNRCLIGMGAVILDGAIINEGSIVAAGSLVPKGKEYPANSLIIGNPAQVKRSLTEKEIEFLRWSAEHYVRLAESY